MQRARLLGANAQSGRPAGFGFVEFDDAETVRAAIALLDGRLVNQRPMKVGHSKDSGLDFSVQPIPQGQACAIQTAVQNSFNRVHTMCPAQ